MNAEKINNLLDELYNKRITKSSSNIGTYTADLIDKDSRFVVEQIIRHHILDDRDEKIGVLEAKVFMYEQIISKSNFAPMIKEQPTEKELVSMDKKDLN